MVSRFEFENLNEALECFNNILNDSNSDNELEDIIYHVGLCSDYLLSNKLIRLFVDFVIKNYKRFDCECYLNQFRGTLEEKNILFKKYIVLLFYVIDIPAFHYTPIDVADYIVSRSFELDYEFGMNMFGEENYPYKMLRLCRKNSEFISLFDSFESDEESEGFFEGEYERIGERFGERFEERFEEVTIKSD